MLTGPDAFYTVATDVLDAVRVRLAARQAVDRVGVVPGGIAWDDCDCGQLVATYVRFFLSDTFPLPRATGTARLGCDAAYIVGELLIQVVRCAPSPQGNALDVPVAALQASARLVLADGYDTLQAADCELSRMVVSDDIDDYLVNDQVFVGPEGGCVGSELRVTVALRRVGG